MGFLNVKSIELIYSLLTGFVAAWIFYGLTAHPKTSPFERVVQALIFSTIIQAVLIPLRALSLYAGSNVVVWGIWNENTSLVISVLIAVLLGVSFSSLANTSKLHDLLPNWISKRRSYPSEWFSAFNNNKRYIYLHLDGNRRIYGWPYESPDQSDRGHFILRYPEWVLNDNTRIPIITTHEILIPVTEVMMVEFDKFKDEYDCTVEELKEYEELNQQLFQQNETKKEE